MVGAWVAAAVIVFGAAGTIGAAFDAQFEVPESGSRAGFDVLDTHFGGLGSGTSGTVVFRSDAGIDDPVIRAAMEEMFAKIAAFEGVSIISPYEDRGAAQVDASRQVAFASISMVIELDFTETGLLGKEFAALAPEIAGLQVEIGGDALAEFEPPESEFIGIAFAVIVLVIAFGSVLAMGLPIAIAIAGVGIGIGLIILISNLTTMPDFATTLGAMIGLGVGIDYALFIVTRYREGLTEGRSPEEATVAALDTAGRAVIFAGITVVISLLGMLLMGLAFISGLGIGAAVTVAVTMVASVTLLPALLGFAGRRVEVTRWAGLIAAGLVAVALFGVGVGAPPPLLLVPIGLAVLVVVGGMFLPRLNREVPRRPPRPRQETLAYRWSRLVQARPLVWLMVGTTILLIMASPVLALRLGFSDEGNYSEETTTRRAYDLLSDGFGPGFNGPLLVTAEVGQPSDREALQPLVDSLAAAPGVASVGSPFPSDLADPENANAYLIRVIPETAPQDEETTALVELLRSDIIPASIAGTALDVNVTGTVAVNIDFSTYLGGRLFIFLGAVLALSFILLMMVFRSLLVPLKAVVLNLLSVGAAYGVIVAVFQWGWGSSILGIEGAPIEPFIPMMMFAIVFGLSMDYEVFLLSRVREEFDRTGDPVGSVADGLAATASVITAAALIMIVVFGSFVLEDNRVIKLFGFGLAVAILIDASLVRMLLVPATMELLGKRNWWLPGWLGRLLPVINVEGSAHEAMPAESTSSGG